MSAVRTAVTAASTNDSPRTAQAQEGRGGSGPERDAQRQPRKPWTASRHPHGMCPAGHVVTWALAPLRAAQSASHLTRCAARLRKSGRLDADLEDEGAETVGFDAADQAIEVCESTGIDPLPRIGERGEAPWHRGQHRHPLAVTTAGVPC